MKNCTFGKLPSYSLSFQNFQTNIIIRIFTLNCCLFTFATKAKQSKASSSFPTTSSQDGDSGINLEKFTSFSVLNDYNIFLFLIFLTETISRTDEGQPMDRNIFSIYLLFLLYRGLFHYQFFILIMFFYIS